MYFYILVNNKFISIPASKATLNGNILHGKNFSIDLSTIPFYIFSDRPADQPIDRPVAQSVTPFWDFYEHYFTPARAAQIATDLQSEIDATGGLEQKQIVAFGKIHNEPRLSQVFGTKKYKYSKVMHEPRPFTKTMLSLLTDINKFSSGYNYNTLVYNYYEDGSKYIAEHSDNEKEIVQEAGIVSISFGSTRTFRLKSKSEPKETTDLELTDGSLLYMKPGCQENYTHQLPKRLKVKTPRINLTFRHLR